PRDRALPAPVAAAVDPDEDRPPAVVDRGRADVQGEAVLVPANARVARQALARQLRRGGAEADRVAHAGPALVRLGRTEAPSADRRRGVGDPREQERASPFAASDVALRGLRDRTRHRVTSFSHGYRPGAGRVKTGPASLSQRCEGTRPSFAPLHGGPGGFGARAQPAAPAAHGTATARERKQDERHRPFRARARALRRVVEL